MATLTKAQRKDITRLINALQAADTLFQMAREDENAEDMREWRFRGYEVMIELADTYGIELPYLEEARKHLEEEAAA
jgi:hypothetical protein